MTVIWAGLAIGAIYTLAALSYTLVFIPSGTFDFAQAFFFMIGTLMAYTTLVTWHLPWIVAVAVCGIVGGLAGYVEERVALRPIRGKGTHAELVTTVGFGFLITGVVQLIWGTSPLTVPFVTSNSSFSLFGGYVKPGDLVLIVVAAALAAGLWYLSRHTLVGLASLAAAQDADAARLKGIDVTRLSGLAVVLACALSGVAGPLIAPKTFAITTLGSSLVIVAFVAVILGGVGSFIGAAIGGFSMGLVEALGSRYIGSEYQNILVLGVLSLVLLVRPTGILGRAGNRRLV